MLTAAINPRTQKSFSMHDIVYYIDSNDSSLRTNAAFLVIKKAVLTYIDALPFVVLTNRESEEIFLSKSNMFESMVELMSICIVSEA